MELVLSSTWDSMISTACTFFGLSFVMLSIAANAVGFIVSLLCLPRWPAVAFIALQAALIAYPLRGPRPAWAMRFIEFTFRRAQEYFPIRLVMEDEGAMDPDTPKVYGFEPHDTIPLNMFMFLNAAKALPDPLSRRLRVLVSSACLIPPLLRHYFYWGGVRAVSRQHVTHLLEKKTSCVLCPGGVKECLYAKQDGRTDVAYLSKRTGFVKLAMQHGADVVPVWCFGQRDLYSFLRPFIDWPAGLVPLPTVAAVSRMFGCLPMLIWGQYGTPLPRRVPVTVVVGAPIKVPRNENPSRQEVELYLKKYIVALEALHAKHQAKYGNGADLSLAVL